MSQRVTLSRSLRLIGSVVRLDMCLTWDILFNLRGSSHSLFSSPPCTSQETSVWWLTSSILLAGTYYCILLRTVCREDGWDDVSGSSSLHWCNIISVGTIRPEDVTAHCDAKSESAFRLLPVRMCQIFLVCVDILAIWQVSLLLRGTLTW